MSILFFLATTVGIVLLAIHFKTTRDIRPVNIPEIKDAIFEDFHT